MLENDELSEEDPSIHQARTQIGGTKINFLGLETARWGGGLPREGVVVEKLCPPSKVCLPWVSMAGTRDAL